jgi:hypothetical protein
MTDILTPETCATSAREQFGTPGYKNKSDKAPPEPARPVPRDLLAEAGGGGY